MTVEDPFDSPEWHAYVQQAEEKLIPMMRECGKVLTMVPRGDTDVKFAVELGFSIMLDKPIIAVVLPGATVPPKLAKIADAVVEVDLNDPASGERLADVIRAIK